MNIAYMIGGRGGKAKGEESEKGGGGNTGIKSSILHLFPKKGLSNSNLSIQLSSPLVPSKK